MTQQPRVTDFELSAELQELQNETRRFATEEVAPRAAELDRAQSFPGDLVQRAGELGYLKMTVPAKYGGTEMGSLCLEFCPETRADRPN